MISLVVHAFFIYNINLNNILFIEHVVIFFSIIIIIIIFNFQLFLFSSKSKQIKNNCLFISKK